jgi:hypothetical protein
MTCWRPVEDERAGSADYDYLLGISALAAGQPGLAVFALERVLAVEPNNDLARAEIARTYFELSEFENSKNQLETVRDSDQVPDAARASMDRYLSLIERAQGKGTSMSGYVTIGAGYDTNVNSGTGESQVAIPFLNTNLLFQLVDQAREQNNAYALVAAGGNIAHPLNETFSVVGGARGYYRGTESPFSTRDIYLYGGVRAKVDKHEFTVAAQGEHFEVNADTLRYVYGGFGQWAFAYDNRTRLSLALQISQIDYPAVPNRDVVRYIGSFGLVHAIGGKREPLLYAGLYGGTEDVANNRFLQFGHDVFGARLGGSLALLPRLRGYASVAAERRDYGGQDGIFLRQRDDTQLIISGGLEYALSAAWKVRPNVSFTNNNSNIPISDYNRIVAGIDVTLRF